MNQEIRTVETTELPEDIQLLNVRQVSKLLGLSYNGMYDLINANKIKSVKIGARRLFTVKAVRKYIASLEEIYG